MALENGSLKLVYWLLGALLTILLAVIGFTVEMQREELAAAVESTKDLTFSHTVTRERVVSLEKGDEAFKEKLDDIRDTQKLMDSKLDRLLRNR